MTLIIFNVPDPTRLANAIGMASVNAPANMLTKVVSIIRKLGILIANITSQTYKRCFHVGLCITDMSKVPRNTKIMLDIPIRI